MACYDEDFSHLRLKLFHKLHAVVELYYVAPKYLSIMQMVFMLMYYYIIHVFMFYTLYMLQYPAHHWDRLHLSSLLFPPHSLLLQIAHPQPITEWGRTNLQPIITQNLSLQPIISQNLSLYKLSTDVRWAQTTLNTHKHLVSSVNLFFLFSRLHYKHLHRSVLYAVTFSR